MVCVLGGGGLCTRVCTRAVQSAVYQGLCTGAVPLGGGVVKRCSVHTTVGTGWSSAGLMVGVLHASLRDHTQGAGHSGLQGVS